MKLSYDTEPRLLYPRQEYWQQSFFIRLTISEKTVASKETILTFARIVSEKISR